MADKEETPPVEEKKRNRAARATGAVWGLFKGAWRWLNETSVRAWVVGLLIVPVLIIYILPIQLVIQQIESFLYDREILGYRLHDPDSEGAIVVDTPQLFTRERLINERLKENTWIDGQLEKVEDFLEKGDFARPDRIQMSRTIATLAVEASKASDEASKGEMQDRAVALAKEAGLMSRSPLKQIEAAQAFREALSVRRYENILDDTHDLGENTVHRMNFNLHVSPARSRSDSLAVVTMTVREPQDIRLLFNHYGQLMIDTRQELEITVRDLMSDRLNIFRRNTAYSGLQSREEEILKGLIDRFSRVHGIKEPQRMALTEGFMLEIAETATATTLDNARSYIVQVIERMGYASLTSSLLPDQGEVRSEEDSNEFLNVAAQNMVSMCGQRASLLTLAPEIFNRRSPAYQGALEEQKRRMSRPPQGAQGAGQPPDGQMAQGDQSGRNQGGAAGLASAQRGAPQPSGQNGQHQAGNGQPQTGGNGGPPIEEIKQRLNTALDQPLILPCMHTQNLYTIAQLRLLGLLVMLSAPEDFEGKIANDRDDVLSNCLQGGEPGGELGKVLTGVALGRALADAASLGPQSLTFEAYEGSDECELIASRVRALSQQVRSVSAEIGTVGLSFVIRDILKSTRMDSTVRDRTLGDYFKFHIPSSCSLRDCLPRVASYAEHQLDIAARDGERPRPNLGREEALRLHLELSCFAHVRSYTVWPRAGERQATLATEQSRTGLSGILSSITTDVLQFGASREVEDVGIRETDHIYGLTDWGKQGRLTQGTPLGGEDNPIGPNVGNGLYCSNVVSKILDRLDPESPDGMLWQATEVMSEFKGTGANRPEAEWMKAILGFIEERHNCEEGAKDCPQPAELTLDDLAWAAIRSRPQETSFAWIVSPRTVTWSGVKAHVPLNVPLAAMISVPSWWGHVELEVHTCWIRPDQLRASFRVGNICDRDPTSAEDMRSLLLPLPSRAHDVLQRMGFFIIRAPYLDAKQDGGELVETGRPAAIRLVGKRLWKNPRVRLGQQWHDEIEVLPNMGGIIARFGCVESAFDQSKALTILTREKLLSYSAPTSQEPEPAAATAAEDGQNGGGGQNRQRQQQDGALGDQRRFEEVRRVEVWTSEGVTQPTQVKVVPFRPRYVNNGEHERPCWLDQKERAAKTASAGGN